MGWMAIVALLGSLTLFGCQDNDEEDETPPAPTPPAVAPASAPDLQNRTFGFAAGDVFGIDPTLGVVSLTFGDFGGTTQAPFRLQAGGFEAAGEAALGSCDLHVNDDNFPDGRGPQTGARLILNPCDFDRTANTLQVANAAGTTATSQASTVALAPPRRLRTPSRSTSIAMTVDDRYVIVVNQSANRVSIIEVRNEAGNDTARTVAEMAVGQEPRAVALSPDNREAYVSNALSGTVSVISLIGANAFSVVGEIAVGTEPRGLAVTPNGTQLYVANHTAGTVSVIDVLTRTVVATLAVGRNPTAIAISNDRDADDTDETVLVTEFFAEFLPGGPGEGFDDGKQGVVYAFATADTAVVTPIVLLPMASGFSADRTEFCQAMRTNPAPLHSEIFCPSDSGAVATTPQNVFPNQLQAALIRNGRLFLPNIGAQPEPPVRFNVNVQALVYVVDTVARRAIPERHVNINVAVLNERRAGNTQGLNGLFGNDLVAIDGNEAGSMILLVSRGGNYVMRASVDNTGAINPGTANIIRYQTGNIPTGVVVSHNGRRAYTNNTVGHSVTAINLETNTVIDLDIPSSEPPAPGTAAHRALVGELAFFTALGIPNNDIFDTPIRDFIPLDNAGKASSGAWSSCASCHPDGLSDGVTWIFATGPRQTVPLDAFFAGDNPGDQRISNWNAVRGSVTDFNNNSRNVQGGEGFADDPTAVFNHGLTRGISEALDAMTDWVQTVRPLRMPQPDDTTMLTAGQTIFMANCAGCHGGAKWTKSRVIYPHNPTFDSNPLAGGVPLDDRIANAGPQIRSFTVDGQTIQFLENVGTFVATDPLEIRGADALGTTALGALGFNVPSLFGAGYHAPYLHHGQAQTLDEVFMFHGLEAGTIATTLTVADQEALLVFLRALDDRTTPPPSETDTFLAGLSGQLGATLSPAQEIPPVSVTSTASGTATLTVNAARTEIAFTLNLVGPFSSPITQGHIHVGRPGQAGGILLFLCTNLTPPDGVPTPQACPGTMGGTLTGTLTAADFRVGGQNTIATFERAVVALLTGNTYLNFHTADNPSGEVRGQVGPLGFAVPLSGAQEAPPAGPVDTPGNGTATLTLNAAQDTMTYTLSYAQLATNVTQAHIHVGPRGENGPVVLFLCGDTPPAGVMTPICPDAPGTDRVTVSGAVGMADLRPNDLGITALREVIDNLIAGNTYVNAHTVTFPGGEIRGQID